MAEARVATGRGRTRGANSLGSGVVGRFVDDLGGVARLAGLVFVQLFRKPLGSAPEFFTEIWFMLRIATVPLVLMSFALSFGPAGVQASNFLGLLGALDRLGAAYVLITIREFAPLVTAITLAGVAGTAMCADLGARKIRDELDALGVLAVDVVRALVVPRVLTVIVLALAFNVLAVVGGVLGAMVVVEQNHAALGPFFATFFANATTIELAASFVKVAIFGAIIGITACYKGLTVSQGPAGVGRAVNQSVVVAFLAIGVVDYVFTQFLLAVFPVLSQVRG